MPVVNFQPKVFRILIMLSCVGTRGGVSGILESSLCPHLFCFMTTDKTGALDFIWLAQDDTTCSKASSTWW